MNEPARARDEVCERKERIGFVVLQHLLTIAGEDAVPRVPGYIAADLALPFEEAVEVLELLAEEGMISWAAWTGPVQVTTAGAEYVTARAGRRRSVRRGQTRGREALFGRRPAHRR
jgi:hypothetical protein